MLIHGFTGETFRPGLVSHEPFWPWPQEWRS